MSDKIPGVEAAKNLVKDVYSKFRSPVYLTFIFSVLLWNWELTLYILFTENNGEQMINTIKNGVYPIRVCWPFATTALIHIFYPFLHVGSDKWADMVVAMVEYRVDVFRVKLLHRRNQNESLYRLEADHNVEAARIQAQIDEAGKRFDSLRKELSDISSKNQELDREVADAKKKLSEFEINLKLISEDYAKKEENYAGFITYHYGGYKKRGEKIMRIYENKNVQPGDYLQLGTLEKECGLHPAEELPTGINWLIANGHLMSKGHPTSPYYYLTDVGYRYIQEMLPE